MNPTQLLEQLKWSLQAVALPADLQLQQFPDFVVITDELMLEFDNWWRAAAGAHTFSAEQHAALHELEKLFDRMSELDVAELSVESELREHPRWQEARQFARRALELFGWSCELPPQERLVYVRGRDA